MYGIASQLDTSPVNKSRVSSSRHPKERRPKQRLPPAAERSVRQYRSRRWPQVGWPEPFGVRQGLLADAAPSSGVAPTNRLRFVTSTASGSITVRRRTPVCELLCYAIPIRPPAVDVCHSIFSWPVRPKSLMLRSNRPSSAIGLCPRPGATGLLPATRLPPEGRHDRRQPDLLGTPRQAIESART